MASFFTFLEHSLYVCTSRLVGLIFSVLAAVLTQINTDALTVCGFLWVICSARRPLAWPQRFSCHSGTERHLIPRHERIRSVLSTSVGKVLLFPFYFLLCQYVFWSTRRWKIQQLCCSVLMCSLMVCVGTAGHGTERLCRLWCVRGGTFCWEPVVCWAATVWRTVSPSAQGNIWQFTISQAHC